MELKATSSQYAKSRVLLVEDDKVNQMVACKMLEKLNCEITLANNGEEAVKLFSQFDFDLVFMDIQMPVMNGIDATLEIRQRHHQTIPIIALTANVMEDDQNKYFEVGMDDILFKPLQLKQLEKTLTEWLRK